MKKILFVILFIVLISKTNVVNATTREELLYEINEMKIVNNNLEITGWGFIVDAQNYYNNLTHRYTLQVNSSLHNFEVIGELLPISQTTTMELIGSRFCKDNEFNMNSTVCNNHYENVGFKFKIPLSNLRMNEKYYINLKVEAMRARVAKSIAIYFPLNENLVLKSARNNYIINSKLNDTKLRVMFDRVYVRSNTDKLNNLLISKYNCKNSKNLYYLNNSRFNKIYDRKFVNNTTYYALSGSEAGCINDYPVVKEGSGLYPILIASNFVDYEGLPLYIETKYVNNKPRIDVMVHPVVYENDLVDILDQVFAYDDEDGDITHKIEVIENNYQDVVGEYQVKYKVVDSDNEEAYAIKNISVLKRNYPPIINAFDITVRQYKSFDPFNGVSAFDQDKTVITNKVVLLNQIDTSIIQISDLCYYVKDKYNLDTTKCVKVNVIKNDTNFRFISKLNLFYLENQPIIWKDKIDIINNEINNSVVYYTRSIKK